MSRQQVLITLLERLIKQDYLYSDKKLSEIKKTLKIAKNELAFMKQENLKGSGNDS